MQPLSKCALSSWKWYYCSCRDWCSAAPELPFTACCAQPARTRRWAASPTGIAAAGGAASTEGHWKQCWCWGAGAGHQPAHANGPCDIRWQKHRYQQRQACCLILLVRTDASRPQETHATQPTVSLQRVCQQHSRKTLKLLTITRDPL